jgi:hypothetical protein
MKTPKSGPGRPQKYGRPSHAVTVSLPEDVLDRLRSLDADLGRAIVALVEQQTSPHAHTLAPAELTSYGNHAVIVVDQATVLKQLPGVQLVPTGNGRALISLDHPNSIPRLELHVRDAMDSDISTKERQTLEALAGILRHARSSPGVTLQERSIIVLESRRQH